MANSVTRHWWPRPNSALDTIVAVGVIAIDLGTQIAVTAGAHIGSARLGLGAVLLALLSGGSLWWRRRRPLLVLGFVVGALVVTDAVLETGLASQQVGIPLVLAVYSVASWSTHRRWAAAVPAAFFALVVAGTLEHEDLGTALALASAAVALPWAMGYAARTRRLYLEQVERRLAEVERDRDERARRAVMDERTRIARELHDVVAHHVSLIGVQAGAARAALDRAPQATRAALAAIEAASREAVGEMRCLLDVLGTMDEPTSRLGPQPGLAELDHLVDGFRAAGVDVTVDRRGSDACLSPALDLSCYRVIEEALTNVSKHSAAGRAHVEVFVDDVSVRLTVRDPGPARNGTAGSGHGLVGMAERVALFGGTLVSGPAEPGGFAVEATLPCREAV